MIGNESYGAREPRYENESSRTIEPMAENEPIATIGTWPVSETVVMREPQWMIATKQEMQNATTNA